MSSLALSNSAARSVDTAAGWRAIPIAPCCAALISVVAWCLPNHYRPWTSFHTELTMAAAFGVLIVWALWATRSAEPRLPTLALVALLALVVPLAQWLGGTLLFAGDFWLVALYLAGFALAVVTGWRMAASEGLERLLGFLSWTVLLPALLSVWLGLYQWQELRYLWVFAEPMPPIGRIIANLGQPNHVATLLVLALAASAWLHDSGRIDGRVALLLTAFLGFGLAMTQSRVGTLSATAGFIWLLALHRHVGHRLKPPRLALAFVVVLAGTIAWTAIIHLSDGGSGRNLDEVAAAGHRLTHWLSMLDAVSRSPWVGYGWTQVSMAQAAVAGDHRFTGEIIEHSHNLAIDLLVWNGLPVGALLLLALGLWGWRVIRRARTTAAIVGAAMVGAIFIHALLEFALEYSYFLLPAGLLMGAVTQALMPEASWRVPRLLEPTLALGLGVLLALVTVDYMAVEADLLAIRFEQARIGVDKPRLPVPDVRLLDQQQAFLRIVRIDEPADVSDEQLDDMRRTARRFPYSIVLLRYAAAAALHGRVGDARAALKPICHTHPASVCKNARLYWDTLAARHPQIAAVAWP